MHRQEAEALIGMPTYGGIAGGGERVLASETEEYRGKKAVCWVLVCEGAEMSIACAVRGQ